MCLEKLRNHLAAFESAFSGWILKSRYQRGVLTLEGAGFGHGVGMCQYGSEASTRWGGLAWFWPSPTPEQKSQPIGGRDLAFNQ